MFFGGVAQCWCVCVCGGVVEKERSELEIEGERLRAIFTDPQAVNWTDILELDDHELRKLIISETTSHVALVIHPLLGVAFMPVVKAMAMLKNSESSRVRSWGGDDLWFSVDEKVFADFEERKIGDENRNQPAKAVLYPPPSKKALREGARDRMDLMADIYGPVVFYKDTSCQ